MTHQAQQKNGSGPAVPTAGAGRAETSAALSAPAQIWDKAGLLARVLDDEDFARQIVHDFALDVPDRLRDVRACITGRDHDGVMQQAHALKGSAANLGAGCVREAAARLERYSPTGPDSLPALMRELENAVNEFLAAVDNDARSV